MAEPVRKCAGCRLRVQGVRTWKDGLSYCAKCIAQFEDDDGAQDAVWEDQEAALEDMAVAEPTPEPITEETPVTTTVSSEQPATKAAAPEQGARDGGAVAEMAAEVAAARPPLTASEDAGALTQVLAMERDSLERQRSELLDEMRQIESKIDAIDVRVSHVEALLQPDQRTAA